LQAALGFCAKRRLGSVMLIRQTAMVLTRPLMVGTVLSQLTLYLVGGTACLQDGSECPASSQPRSETSGVNLLQFGNVVRSELPAELAQATDPDSYRLCQGTYTVGGYTCGVPAGQDDTKIFFPCNQKDPGAFPVVVYGHGMGGRGEMDASTDAFRMVVGLGLIIIAPYTNGYEPGGCSSKTEYRDLLRALEVSESNPALHKALPRVDWSRQAVWGYSMGGKTAPLAVKSAPDARIQALVASHGARECDGITVPSLLLTGTRDTASSPPEVMRRQFDSVQARHKVFLNLEGAYHDEPLAAGRLNVWVGRFLACHLGLPDSCGSIYHTAHDICQDQTFAHDGCIVLGGSPSTPVGGSPSPPVSCTANGADPYATGKRVDCCSPLVGCLGDHDGTGHWSYQCSTECPGASPPDSSGNHCTGEGADPYATGKKVACCSSLVECLGDHGNGGSWFYKCLAGCPGA